MKIPQCLLSLRAKTYQIRMNGFSLLGHLLFVCYATSVHDSQTANNQIEPSGFGCADLLTP